MLKLNAFQLKCIAILGMVLYHIIFPWQYELPPGIMIVLSAAGGLTFPIMAYFIVEGYKHTSNLTAYMKRLAVFGVISIPFHILVFGMFRFNIMFTIIVSLFCLALYDYIKSKPVFWSVFVIISLVTALAFDWFAFGPITVLLYYIIKNETMRRVASGIVAGLAWLVMGAFTYWGLAQLQAWYSLGGVAAYNARFGIDMIYSMMGNTNLVLSSMFLAVGSFVSSLLVLNYNGERGRKMKWLFYSFYPIHLAVLGVLSLILT